MGNRTLRIMCIYINIASNTRKKILEFFREIVSENCSAQEHNMATWPIFEPGSLALETSALSVWPLLPLLRLQK